jgi:hypothetical protein
VTLIVDCHVSQSADQTCIGIRPLQGSSTIR